MPQNPSLLISQETQEQVLPLLLYGFSKILASIVFLGQTPTLIPYLHQHKIPSIVDNRAMYNDEVKLKETRSLNFSHL